MRRVLRRYEADSRLLNVAARSDTGDLFSCVLSLWDLNRRLMTNCKRKRRRLKERRSRSQHSCLLWTERRVALNVKKKLIHLFICFKITISCGVPQECPSLLKEWKPSSERSKTHSHKWKRSLKSDNMLLLTMQRDSSSSPLPLTCFNPQSLCVFVNLNANTHLRASIGGDGERVCGRSQTKCTLRLSPRSPDKWSSSSFLPLFPD